MIPRKAFLINGKGVHEKKLVSFELALRNAGIEKFNLSPVTSILPPGCKIVSREEGLKLLKPGQIVHCILARNQTKKPGELLCAAVGTAVLAGENNYGYVSEHHSFGEEEEVAGECAACLAGTMLATAHDKEFEVEARDEKKTENGKVYRAGEQLIEAGYACQTAYGAEDGKWTTVVAAVVFVE